MEIETRDARCDMITRLKKEKALVARLAQLLKEELQLISNGSVEALEDSMPEKQRILQAIAENRKGQEIDPREERERETSEVHRLKQDLVRLWKRASGLNDLSKTMVAGRLAEIERELEPFFARTKSGYTRDGKKSRGTPRRVVNTGA